MGLCISYPSSSSKKGLQSNAKANNHSNETEISSTTATTCGGSVGRQWSQFSEAASENSGQIIESPNLKVFSFSELKIITKNFKPDLIVGEGGFGQVYRGCVDAKTLAPSKASSGMIVAVKRLSPDSFQGFEEWRSTVNFLGMLSHPNFVKLLGYCREDKELLLIYEFMPKGSLEKSLFGRNELTWDLRMKILIGVARGLAFLHGLQREVIHRNLSATNILLDSNYDVKLSAFGIAKLGPSQGESHVTTRVMGTFGYAAPEYMATGHLYVKSDVFSFGMVLLEIMTGLRAHDPKRPSGQQSLENWLRPQLSSKHKIKKIMDKRIKGQFTTNVAIEMGRVALSCIEQQPINRPHMSEVLKDLEHIRQINVIQDQKS